MVKLEFLEQGALTAPQVGHLEGGKRGPQTGAVLGVSIGSFTPPQKISTIVEYKRI